MEKIILYHGSRENIEKPEYGKGKPYNDYGQGFYMTEEDTMAGEWAVAMDRDGFINQYLLNLDGLKILDLRENDLMTWLALLLENRNVRITTPLAEKARDYIEGHYLLNYQEYDVIIGYRADDSYFQFVRAFLYNEITLEQLGLAMNLGNLGIQYCIKSERAFDMLIYLGTSIATRKDYLEKKIKRDLKAKSDYDAILRNKGLSGTYVLDLLRSDSK